MMKKFFYANGVNYVMLTLNIIGGGITGVLGAIWLTDYIHWPKELSHYHYVLMIILGLCGSLIFGFLYYINHSENEQ